MAPMPVYTFLHLSTTIWTLFKIWNFYFQNFNYGVLLRTIEFHIKYGIETRFIDIYFSDYSALAERNDSVKYESIPISSVILTN